MTINEAFSKVNLCCEELLIIKEILDTKEADDFCSRMLSIYAMVRVDDIMKIWGNTIPNPSLTLQKNFHKFSAIYLS